MKKIIFVTEDLSYPYDEGIKKTVYNIYQNIIKYYDVKVICRKGFFDKQIRIINTNKLFISSRIKNIIKNFKPDIILYIPFASDTFASYLRLKVLKNYYKKAQTVLVVLQPKKLKKWQSKLIRILKPDFGITTSPFLIKFWNEYSVKNSLIPLYTDLNQFKSIENEKKLKLREKYNLPKEKFIISHIGHINWGRNLESLIPVQQQNNNQVIIVGSSSTPDDAPKEDKLKNKLINNGIMIIDKYIENIQEIYQLSDLYIFPVTFQGGSINMPLSILEARACGIPVLTTDFGSIKYYMGDDNGGIFYDNPENFMSRIEEIKNKIKYTDFRKTEIHSINKKFHEIILNLLNNI